MPLWWKQQAELFLSFLRFMAGAMFIEHGTQKVWNFPLVAREPYHFLTINPGLASVLELGGGTLIVFGLFTRPVAFVLSGFMAFAYFMAHAPRSFYPLVNGGDDAILYCFAFLYISAAGAGPLSLDRLFFGKTAVAR